jgi:transposase
MMIRRFHRIATALGRRAHLWWLLRFRRLSKDYEVLPETSESMIYAAMTCVMLKRLARNPAIYL